ncbi:TPA: helix-turn-helix domain-containing protein [Streptococcus suis]
MKNKIAELILHYRTKKGWSQKQLSEGICTQSVISKIEQAEVSPSVDLFFQLTNKLEIRPEAIIDLIQEKPFERNSIASDFPEKELLNMLYYRQYDAIELYLKFQKKNPETKYEALFTEFLAIVLEYTKQTKSKLVLDKLQSLLEQSTKLTFESLSFRIALAIANIHSEREEYEQANEIFSELLSKSTNITNDLELQLQFLYSYSRVLYLQKQYDKALHHNSLSIELSRKHKTLFLLGNIYLMRANILNKKGLQSTAIENVNRAIILYDIDKDEHLKNIAQSLLIELRKASENDT